MTATSPKTRQAVNIYLLGVKDLECLTRKNQLPTTREILLRFNLRETKSARCPSHCIAEELIVTWQNALIKASTEYNLYSLIAG